jgi:hypothetical protein
VTGRTIDETDPAAAVSELEVEAVLESPSPPVPSPPLQAANVTSATEAAMSERRCTSRGIGDAVAKPVGLPFDRSYVATVYARLRSKQLEV